MAQGKQYLQKAPTERQVADVFDTWYADQRREVMEVVDKHLLRLMRVGRMGEMSAKMLLANVYCLVSRPLAPLSAVLRQAQGSADIPPSIPAEVDRGSEDVDQGDGDG